MYRFGAVENLPEGIDPPDWAVQEAYGSDQRAAVQRVSSLIVWWMVGLTGLTAVAVGLAYYSYRQKSKPRRRR